MFRWGTASGGLPSPSDTPFLERPADQRPLPRMLRQEGGERTSFTGLHQVDAERTFLATPPHLSAAPPARADQRLQALMMPPSASRSGPLPGMPRCSQSQNQAGASASMKSSAEEFVRLKAVLQAHVDAGGIALPPKPRADGSAAGQRPRKKIRKLTSMEAICSYFGVQQASS
ncbi:hypothetical protein WJX72_010445 [[Myrmecia] bisecta]|uniref:Uncharacterized protein n=1 Tax=[Myrmecia] bisecta TaxID=41462 RepID=A0AAW1QSM6_9CHLO